MRAKTENLARFREALVKGESENMIRALTHDFGTRENARIVMAYMRTAASAWRVENRVMNAGSFLAGIVVTLIIGAIVRIFV